MNLHWSLADTYHTTNIGLANSTSMSIPTIYVNVSTLSYAKRDKCKEWCGTTLKTYVNTLQNDMRPIVCHAIECNKDSHEK